MSLIFTTLLFISLLSCIALFSINYILNKNPKLVRKNYRFFLICLILIGFRLFLPFDLPTVYVIKVTEVLPEVFLFLYKPRFTLLDMSISIFKIFSITWIIGTFICIIKLLLSYHFMLKIVHGLKSYEDDRLLQIMCDILNNYKKPVPFHLVTTDQITTPAIFGVRNPYIIVPENSLGDENLLGDEDWHHILSHEVAHYYHGDMYLKFLFEVLHAVYWWNPLYYIIKRLISILLEVNIDLKLSQQLDATQKLSYLECLLKVARKREHNKSPEFSVAFNGDSSSVITKRIHIIMSDTDSETKKHPYFLNHYVTVMLTLCVLILPFFFTIAPTRVSDEKEKETFSITTENAFLVVTENNTYDLYVDGKLLINIESPDNLNENLKIYAGMKEVPPSDEK